MGQEDTASGSSVLSPIRTLGVLTNRLPIHVYQKGLQKFILASLGSSYVIYNADNLHATFISTNFHKPIIALTADSNADLIYIALSNCDIAAYNRHERLWLLPTGLISIKGLNLIPSSKNTKPSNKLIAFKADGSILTIDTANGNILNHISTALSSSMTEELSILNPSQLGGLYNCPAVTCPEKFCWIGGYGPCLQKINLLTGQSGRKLRSLNACLIKILDNMNEKLASPSVLEDWRIDSIEFCEEKIIIAAINSYNSDHLGLIPSIVLIIDSEADSVLSNIQLSPSQLRINCLSLKEKIGIDIGGSDEEGPISADPGDHTLLFIGCENGDIMIFNLENMKTASVINSAHTVVSMPCLDEQAGALLDFGTGCTSVRKISSGGDAGCLFVSSGADNAIVIWHLQDVDNPPLVLKERRALSGVVQDLSFYDAGDEAKKILATSNILGSAPRSKESGRVGELNYYQIQQHFIYPIEGPLKSINAKRKAHSTRLGPITGLAHNIDRHFDWPNIITCHKNTHEVYMWSADRRILAIQVLESPKKPEQSHALPDKTSFSSLMIDINTLSEPPRPTRTAATSVALSFCGNFAIVGYFDGSISIFNVQSRRFITSLAIYDQDTNWEADMKVLKEKALNAMQETNPSLMLKKQRLMRQEVEQRLIARKSSKHARNPHTGAVSFLHCIGAFTVISISSGDKFGGGEELVLRYWNMKTHKLIDEFDLKESGVLAKARKLGKWTLEEPLKIQRADFNGNTAILSITNSKHEGDRSNVAVIVMVDLLTKSLVRTFGPFDGSIVQANLNPLGTWLVVTTASYDDMEGDLNIFDILSNRRIEWLRFPSGRITSFTFHPSGAFILTAHDQAGRRRADPSFDDCLYARGGIIIWANVVLFARAGSIGAKKVSEPRSVCIPPAATYIENEVAVKDEPVGALSTDWLEQLGSKVPPLKYDEFIGLTPNWGSLQLQQLLEWEDIRDSADMTAKNINEDKDVEQSFFLYSEDKLANLPLAEPIESKTIVDEETIADPEDWNSEAEADWCATDALPSGAAPIVRNPSENSNSSLKSINQRNSLRQLLQSDILDPNAVLDYLLKSKIPRIHIDLSSLHDQADDILRFLDCAGIWCSQNKAIDFVHVLIKLFFKSHGSDIIDKIINQQQSTSSFNLKLNEHLNKISRASADHWNAIGDSLNCLICYIKLITLMQYE